MSEVDSTKNSDELKEAYIPGEIWKDIPGYEGLYQASDLGRIRSLDRIVPFYTPRWKLHTTKTLRGRILKQAATPYLGVSLSKDGVLKPLEVHRLILLTFVGPCPEGMECCHKDGNRRNNRLTNLRWDTRKNNFHDNIANGTRMYGKKNPKTKLTKQMAEDMRRLWATKEYTQDEIAKMFKVGQTLISNVVRNKARY